MESETYKAMELIVTALAEYGPYGLMTAGTLVLYLRKEKESKEDRQNTRSDMKEITTDFKNVAQASVEANKELANQMTLMGTKLENGIGCKHPGRAA